MVNGRRAIAAKTEGRGRTRAASFGGLATESSLAGSEATAVVQDKEELPNPRMHDSVTIYPASTAAKNARWSHPITGIPAWFWI
jgi:hypothetical protein